MAVEIDQAVPFPDVADQAFSVRSARQAGQASRHARDELWAGGAAARPGGAADQAPEAAAAEQAVGRPPRRHLRAICRLVANWVLNKEGEEHQRLRRPLNSAFSRRIIDRLRPGPGRCPTGLASPYPVCAVPYRPEHPVTRDDGDKSL
jgi:cytochrome P450